jgi:demethylmenaquinone methyltransferase/2-methoxy-6-polyprenyl-1,4-benzoquinol methylase
MKQVEDRDPGRVRRMFGGIARHYDLLNHLLSANLDRGWRRAAAARLPRDPLERVLDLCGGTGDLTLEVARQRRPGTVVCCDFAHPMLVRAQEKFERTRDGGRCLTLEADALRLPFAGESFDAITVAFGVRNLADLATGFHEMHRVLRPGGRLIVLEFSQPTGPVLSRLYGFYLRRILPHIGDGISRGRGAYGYLARTIGGFPEAKVLAARIREAGFSRCDWSCPTGGIVAIHTADK